MTNLERETYIQNQLKSGAWKTVPRKKSWQVKTKEGTVIAESSSRHEALKLAVDLTQSKH